MPRRFGGTERERNQAPQAEQTGHANSIFMQLP
jgi:hypothetical protein